MSSSKNVYIEYISIAFLACSFLYFSRVSYVRYINFHNYKQSNTLTNFDIYENILKKYNGKVLDIKVVNGTVEAYISKNEFEYELFKTYEKFLIEEDENKYIIIFKNVRNFSSKNNEAIIEQKIIQIINTIKIDSAYFINDNQWSVYINGKKFSPDNKSMDNIKIINIDSNKITIESNGSQQSFSI